MLKANHIFKDDLSFSGFLNDLGEKTNHTAGLLVGKKSNLFRISRLNSSQSFGLAKLVDSSLLSMLVSVDVEERQLLRPPPPKFAVGSAEESEVRLAARLP